MCDEFQTNFEAEFLADEWSGEVRNNRKPPIAKRPSPRPLPARRRTTIPYAARGGFRVQPYSSEPYAIEPSAVESGGNEKIRWIQECLNHKSGLQLPVNGIAGRETRSAIRDFQRKQGVRVNGLIDPDTERALRDFCRAGATQESELYQTEIGPFTATLQWVQRSKKDSAPTPGDNYVMTLDQARKASGGGVYIMMGDSTRQSGEKDRMLKVGKTEFFSSRFAKYDLPGWKNLRVYIARINKFVPKDAHIERAIARFLYRTVTNTTGANQTQWPGVFPGSRYVPPKQVFGNVKISNILPPPLQSKYRVSPDLLLDSKSQSSYEIAAKSVAPSRCRNCHKTPCSCAIKTCSSHCSCSKCRQPKSPAFTGGNWLRQGNHLHVTGVAP